MARNRILCESSPDEVFGILADPRRYGDFVVGSRTVRRFHPRWPEQGSDIHHSLGVGVTLIKDRSISLTSEPPHLLVLKTMMRPVGIAETAFRLSPHARGTMVELEERPISGPLALPVLAPLVDAMLWLRNRLVLRRLCALAAHRRDR